MKHRGNFYTKNLEDTSNSVKDIYLNICQLASQSDIHLDEKADIDKLMEILLNPVLNNKTKATLAAQAVKALTKQETALVKLMCGLKVKLTDMFPTTTIWMSLIIMRSLWVRITLNWYLQLRNYMML